MMIGVIEQTLLQSAVDDAMRGRILSFYTLIARGCPSIGALAAGGISRARRPAVFCHKWRGPLYRSLDLGLSKT